MARVPFPGAPDSRRGRRARDCRGMRASPAGTHNPSGYPWLPARSRPCRRSTTSRPFPRAPRAPRVRTRTRGVPDRPLRVTRSAHPARWRTSCRLRRRGGWTRPCWPCCWPPVLGCSGTGPAAWTTPGTGRWWGSTWSAMTRNGAGCRACWPRGCWSRCAWGCGPPCWPCASAPAWACCGPARACSGAWWRAPTWRGCATCRRWCWCSSSTSS